MKIGDTPSPAVRGVGNSCRQCGQRENGVKGGKSTCRTNPAGYTLPGRWPGLWQPPRARLAARGFFISSPHPGRRPREACRGVLPDVRPDRPGNERLRLVACRASPRNPARPSSITPAGPVEVLCPAQLAPSPVKGARRPRSRCAARPCRPAPLRRLSRVGRSRPVAVPLAEQQDAPWTLRVEPGPAGVDSGRRLPHRPW